MSDDVLAPAPVDTGAAPPPAGRHADHVEPAAEVAGRLYESFLGTLDLLAVHVGDQLGYYRALASGPATAEELAGQCATHERYTREWLEQQAVAGFLTVEPRAGGAVEGDGAGRRYRLADGVAEALTDGSSLSFATPMARFAAAMGSRVDALTAVHRSGGGVSWRDFGEHARTAQAEMNRPWFETALAPALRGVPELDALLSRPGAVVLDVGCGGGWSTIALAREWPQARVVGVDVDAPSVALARENASAAGTTNAEFIAGDAEMLALGGIDVAFAFECVHDLPRPVEVLRSVRSVLADGAPLVVMDEAVGPSFSTDGSGEHALDRVMYGFSLLLCLPDSLSHPGSVGTGTVMRPDTLERYAREAGFDSVDVLPIEDFGFWRFYRLR